MRQKPLQPLKPVHHTDLHENTLQTPTITKTRQMLTASRGEPENACMDAQGINEKVVVHNSGYASLWM